MAKVPPLGTVTARQWFLVILAAVFVVPLVSAVLVGVGVGKWLQVVAGAVMIVMLLAGIIGIVWRLLDGK